MLAARNALFAKSPLAYDVASSTLAASITSGSQQTLSITAALGADVFLIYTDSTGDTYSNVKCNGATMTAVSPTPVTHAAFGGNGALYIYRSIAAGTGGSINCVFTPSGSTEYVDAIVVSVKNVRAVSSPYNSNPATGTTVSTGALTCPYGGLLLAAFSTSNSGIQFNSSSGGTQLCQFGYPTTVSNLCVRYATANATFSATTNANAFWAAAALALS